MDFLLLHIWPFMAAAAVLGLVSGAVGAILAARTAARRAAEPQSTRRGIR